LSASGPTRTRCWYKLKTRGLALTPRTFWPFGPRVVWPGYGRGRTCLGGSLPWNRLRGLGPGFWRNCPLEKGTMALTLLLADDHQIVRQGLRAILRAEADFQLAGETADGLETVRLVERVQPDVLVLDLMMPGLNGIEVARQVSRRAPRTRVVI